MELIRRFRAPNDEDFAVLESMKSEDSVRAIEDLAQVFMEDLPPEGALGMRIRLWNEIVEGRFQSSTILGRSCVNESNSGSYKTHART